MKIEIKNIRYKKLRQNDWFTSREVEQYKCFGIIKRDTTRCINNLTYCTLREKSKNKIIIKEFDLNNLKKGYFRLDRLFHRAVKCYTVWNNHFNYRIDQNDFIDAMEDLYYARYCDNVALSEKAKTYERIKVRYIAKAEYNRFWKIGETAYRNEFKAEYPECFGVKEKARYTYFDNHTIDALSNVTSIEKTMACNRKRSIDRQNIVIDVLNEITYINIDKFIIRTGNAINFQRCSITKYFLNKVNHKLVSKGFKEYTLQSLRRVLPSIIKYCTRGILESLPDFADAIKMTAYNFRETLESNIRTLKNSCYLSNIKRISIKLLGSNILSGEIPVMDRLNMLHKREIVSQGRFGMFWRYNSLLNKIEISKEKMMAIPTKKKMKGIKGVTHHLLSSEFERVRGMYLKQLKYVSMTVS